MLREDPFAEYSGEKRYHCLICGHTITNYYFTRMKEEKNWPFRKPRATLRNRIFYGEKYVDAVGVSVLLWITRGMNAGIRMIPMNMLIAFQTL